MIMREICIGQFQRFITTFWNLEKRQAGKTFVADKTIYIAAVVAVIRVVVAVVAVVVAAVLFSFKAPFTPRNNNSSIIKDNFKLGPFRFVVLF